MQRIIPARFRQPKFKQPDFSQPKLVREKLTPKELQILFWRAVARGDKDKVRMLMMAGADMHAMDADGRTALHIASQNGQALIYKILLEAREVQEMMQAFQALKAPNTGQHKQGREDERKVA